MTPSEHLQAAKDKVADKHGYTGWDEILYRYYRVLLSPKALSSLTFEACELALTNQAEELRKEITKLQAFKDYVHKRLDNAGIEKDPESEHKERGCRIGGRLDIVLDDGWIDVNDRLPELGEEFNVVWDLKDGQPPVTTTVQWDAIRNIWFDETYPDGVPDILFWQPLPKPTNQSHERK